MKIWFEHCGAWDDAPKLGIDWFKHWKEWPYKGLTITFYFFNFILMIHWVNDYKLYKDFISRKQKVKDDWLAHLKEEKYE